MGSQHTVGKRRRRTAARRQGTRGADIYCIAGSVEEGHGVVVGILGRDLDVKGSPRRLRSDRPTTNRLHHEVIQRPRVYREEVGNSGFRARSQTACIVRSRNREAARIRYGHTMGSQHSVGERRRGTATRRQSPRGADVYCIAGSVKQGHRVVVAVFSRDLDVESNGRRLCPDGSPVLRHV